MFRLFYEEFEIVTSVTFETLLNRAKYDMSYFHYEIQQIVLNEIKMPIHGKKCSEQSLHLNIIFIEAFVFLFH